MSETEAIARFVREIAEHARALPMRDAVVFLQGCLALAGDAEVMAEVRRSYMLLRQGDEQLELIADGQLKLNLGRDGGGDGQ